MTRTARLRDSKTGESTCPLSHAAIAVLKDLPRIEEHVFFGVASSAVKKIAAAAGLPGDVTAHTLRHSFASVAVDIGLSELTIAALLGHAEASITSRIIHS